MNIPITLANGNTVELNNITESGNGYIRFSDGTQICFGTFEKVLNKLEYDQSTIETATCECQITFPKSFTTTPTVTYSGLFSMLWEDNTGRWHQSIIPPYLSNIYITEFSIILTPPFGSLTQLRQLHSLRIMNGNYIAIGKWKYD